MKHSLVTFASTLLALTGAAAAAGLTNSSLTTHVDSVTLDFNFDPVKAAYWTGYIHHRRTPFAVSPSGNVAYLAYLDGSETDVHIQAVDPTTFAATGTTTTISGAKEAGGLIAHDDGFAVLTNEAMPSGTTNAPPDNTPVPVLYRFDAAGTQKWKTWLAGPDIDNAEGHMAAPDMNGDLVYSNVTGRYAAYFVVTAYDGSADGHYGDSIRYVEDSTGDVVNIEGASSDWGCSHNTGIALEAADAAPYASVCAEDQGGVWLNSNGQGMSTVGVKISNENTTNGADGEPLGGMSGSYSNLARWQDGDGYIFAWVTRGAIDLYENSWMGTGYTSSYNRTNGRNVAIATFTDKYTMVQTEASSTVGAQSGDSQVNWITESTTADQSNAHVATFDATNALVTWEEIADPFCEYIAFGCRGTFTGSYFQLVSSTDSGTTVGTPVVRDDVYVSGDMVTMNDGRICWPYVSMDWDLSGIVGWGYTSSNVTKMSFACMSLDSAASASSTAAAAASSSSAPASSAAASSSTVAASSNPVAVAAASPTSSSVPTSSVAPATSQAASTLMTSVIAASSADAAAVTSADAAAAASTGGSASAAPASSFSWGGWEGWSAPNAMPTGGSGLGSWGSSGTTSASTGKHACKKRRRAAQ